MIHYNQVGYGAKLPKQAILTGKGSHCYLLDESHRVVLQPPLTDARFDIASGDTVRIADFSQVTQPGRYFLFADGEKVMIDICDAPYHALNNALVKALYYQRCGCALEEEHAGAFHHAACHMGKATLIHDENVVLDVAGGWHDAGDYGRYIAPAAVTVGHMLYAYELFPQVYGDELNIPESGNGVPDILNECRYELEWMLKMQREDGGLYHKVATRYFAKFVMPEEDLDELLLFRATHCSTAGFAASLAQAYRMYLPYDRAFAETALAAAVKAWNWMEANPLFVPFVNPPDVNSGPYGDDSCEDELFWASCELFAATGEDKYWAAMRARADHVDVSKIGWRECAGFGALNCLFANKNIPDPAFLARMRERVIMAADECHHLALQSGYGTSLSADGYTWGSSLPIMINAMVLILAKMLTGVEAYEKAALAQLDYLLGRNATGYSFVTGFGEKAFRFPHHRPSYADGVDDPVPGMVSGGPNKVRPDKACAHLVPPETPAAKFYIDHTATASANEIAIYWNSPAIFVAAYFDSITRA